MNNDSYSLPGDTKTLQDMVLALQSQVQNLQDEKQQLIEQFRLAQQSTLVPAAKAIQVKASCLTKWKLSLNNPSQQKILLLTLVSNPNVNRCLKTCPVKW